LTQPRQLPPEILDYVATENQRNYLETVIACGGNISEAARRHGVEKSHIHRIIQSCRKRMEMRQAGPVDTSMVGPDSMFERVGDTTLFDGDGKPRLQWVRRKVDEEAKLQAMIGMVEELARDVRPVPPIPPPEHAARDLMALYPMGDPHVGMYAWASECGDDFDLEVAERDLCGAVDYLVARAPDAERGALINVGDFFHAENMAGITTRSGNVLDMDSRLPKVQEVGVRILRRCVERMLEKHREVIVINAPGNHDEVLAHFLNLLLSTLYENNPRVDVRRAPTTRHYIEFGRNLVGVVHGERTKDRDLPGIMATEMPEAWGRTRHRTFLRGHHHHDSRVEYNGCTVEQVRTLAARDAYTVGGGYLSGRDMKCITLHREFGEQTRTTCGIDVLRASP